MEEELYPGKDARETRKTQAAQPEKFLHKPPGGGVVLGAWSLDHGYSVGREVGGAAESTSER